MTTPTPSARHAVIISYYDRRPIEPLHRLLASISQHPAGLPFDLAIVVNSTGEHKLHLPPDLAATVFYRPNHGMNIGAWDHGWRHMPDHDGYLFLQDECYVVRDQWLAAFAASAERGAGLVGESMNTAWRLPWPTLRATLGGQPMAEHLLDECPANRVDVYLDFMRAQDIDPGSDGMHLRSLIWYLPTTVLQAIDGFPLGGNFGECIGAEIGVSRDVIAKGLPVVQVAKTPFHFIRHQEWNQDWPGGPYVHGIGGKRAKRRLGGRNRALAFRSSLASRARRLVRRALGRHSPW